MRLRLFSKMVMGGFGLAALVILVVGFLSYRAVRGLHHDVSWVDHTHENIEAIHRLRAEIRGRAAAFRGYVISRNPEFLGTNHDGGLEELLPAVQALRQATADSPVQQASLDSLEGQLSAPRNCGGRA